MKIAVSRLFRRLVPGVCALFCGIQGQLTASAQDCASTPSGLVAWWRAEGNSDDNLGHFNGIAQNVSFAPGKVGQAFDFNGLNSYVTVPNSPGLGFTNEITLEFWFFSRNWASGGVGLFSKRDGANISNYGLNVSSAYGFDVYYEDPTVSDGDYSPTVSGFEISAYFPLPSLNVFHHAACTFKQSDSDHVRVETYLDGLMVTNKTMLGSLARTLNTAPLIIGATGVGSTRVQYFNGLIDEFSIYNRALSGEEIAALASADSAGKCLPPVAPTITVQPQSQSIVAGSDVTLNVVATGTAPLTYQWRLNGVNLGNGTNASLTITNVQAVNEGTYRVAVSNSAGQVESSEAIISIVTPACTNVPSGLLGWWPGDGDANDFLGQFHGTANNVTYGAGVVGQAFNFNGHNSYIAISNAPELNLTNEISVEFWFLSRRWSGGSGLFSKRDAVLSNYGLNISQLYGLDVYYEDPTVSGGDYSPGISGAEISAFFPIPTLNVFHHFACTMKQVDDSHVRVETYLNGVLATNKTMLGNLTNTINQGSLIIGATGIGNGVVEYFDGMIDEFSIYNRALSMEDVGAIFAAGQWGKCKVPIAPAIAEEPQSQHITAGENGALTVSATGTYPLTFQWRRNESPLPNGTNSTLTLQDTSPSDGGNYDVLVSNAAGSVTSQVAIVTVTVPRILAIESTSPQQEGTRLEVPIDLVSEGDVGGITFLVTFNTNYLRSPDLTWDSSLNGSFNNINTNNLGQVRATFALPATTVPAGTQTLAQLSFFLRSVPQTLTTPLTLQILDMSGASGQTLTGTVARSSSIVDRLRKITGDNNANDRLDVGDATIILRYLSVLDPVRTWDVGLNDLNQNGGLDSGDTIRVLRAASGIDPQPPLPDSALNAFRTQGVFAASPVPNAVLSPSAIQTIPGSNITLQVQLQNTGRPISGAAFKLHYDTNALRLTSSQSYRTGPLIPGNALSVWNIAPFQNVLSSQNGNISLATSSANSWPSTDGVLAELTFQVQPGATNLYQWPVSLSGVETTEDGYVNHSWSAAGSTITARGPLPARLSAVSGLVNGRFTLTLFGDVGASYVVEASSDLVHWTFLDTIVNSSGTTEFVDVNAQAFGNRFYRSHPAP